MKSTQTKLLDSRQALSFYLETLFDDSAEQSEPVVENELAEQEEFEVMKITLGKHKLALPVEDLTGVVGLEKDSLVSLPEQKPYVLGMLRHQGRNLTVYDLNWVFNSSGGLQAPSAQENSAGPSHVIILQGQRTALACDSVQQIIRIQNQQVNWRKSQANQPWMKGVIVDDMSVLLGVKQIKCLFNRGYFNRA